MVLLVAVVPLGAQDQSSPSPPTPTPTPAPSPIPAAEIALHAEQTAVKLRALATHAAKRSQVTEIEASLEGEAGKLARLAADSKQLIAHGAAVTELDDLARRWQREEAILDGWINALQARATNLDADLAEIRQIIDDWQLTRDSADEQDLPPAVRSTIASTLAAAGEARRVLSARRDTVLTLQTKVTALKAEIAETSLPIRDAIEAQRRSALRPEKPPIWKMIGASQPATRPLATRVTERVADRAAAIRAYAEEDDDALLMQALLLLVLIAVFIALGRIGHRWALDGEGIGAAVALIERPIASAVLVSALLEGVINSRAPDAWHNLLEVVLLLALLRLLPRLLPDRLRPAVYVIGVLFIAQQVLTVVPDNALVYRLLLLVLSAATLAALLWLGRRIGTTEDRRLTPWYRSITRACWIGALLMVFAVAANVIGAVVLANTLTQGLMFSIFTALLVWVGIVVLRAAEAIVLRTSVARRLNMVRSNAANIRDATGKLLRFAGIVVWVIATLSFFGVLAAVWKGLVLPFSREITIGSVSFSLLDVAAVLVVVWLTFKLSKFVRFFLETDVYPRFDLPRGLPASISTMTHYLVLVAGFLLVIAMLGLDLTKFAIIAGALSVGIGFGLQNVVNNFVSGLILLFERPIKEGDRIDVGTTSGVVQKIGMRASVLRTWQGADVIVPNADLISAQLVNWTLHDEVRRIEIPVGVAYGTNPEQVLEILLELGRSHPDALGDPAPTALFVAFGESSLDFELRVWTVGDFLKLRSDLHVAINRALADADIEIPFPQRDLHLRSGALLERDSAADSRDDDGDMSEAATSRSDGEPVG